MEARELQAVLAWSALPFVGERSLQALLEHAREGRRTLVELWEVPLDDLTQIVRLHPRARAALEEGAAERWEQAAADADAIRSWGVDVLVPTEPEYPAALRGIRSGARCWPLLFAYGALGLLEEPSVALANSATVSPAGLAATDAVADALARRDVALVTSTNREAYKAAATAAKRHAGPAMMVLDRGIREAFPAGLEREPVAAARVWDEAFDPDLQLLLSPFGWRERWTARSGARRDALIFDLADVILAVDVRSGGIMDRECRAAPERGKRVLALDRGAETAEGTRGLWEEDARVMRLPWTGAEDAAEHLLRALPGQHLESGDDRSRQGWGREIGQFLARACALLDGQASSSRGAVGCYPASGPLARVAASWSGTGRDGTAGVSWLLADLVSEGNHPPSRPLQLLERVARGGLLAAVLPAAWLEEATFAPARAEWLKRAALRMAVRLPQPVTAGAGEGLAAAIVLHRDGEPNAQAPTFAPERERMGRFHLRRYLQEVLAALGSER
jgi:predicted Rossmann fold nucleotide-binding protein DprA/Smf involved in DNA uptake